MSTKDRNEFSVKNKTLDEIMNYIDEKWKLMNHEEKDELVSYLGGTFVREPASREVSFRQIIDGISVKWEEMHNWQRYELTELINELAHENNSTVKLEIVKLDSKNNDVISHVFDVEVINEEDLIRRALLYIFIQKDNPDGTYEINVYFDAAIGEQYLVVIDNRKVILCTEISEINLGLFEEDATND